LTFQLLNACVISQITHFYLLYCVIIYAEPKLMLTNAGHHDNSINKQTYHYVRQQGYVFVVVCLSVCVWNISECHKRNLIKYFGGVRHCTMTNQTLLAISITICIRDHNTNRGFSEDFLDEMGVVKAGLEKSWFFDKSKNWIFFHLRPKSDFLFKKSNLKRFSIYITL